MPEVIRRALPADAQALADIGRETFVATFGHLYPKQDLDDFLASAHSLSRAADDLADPTRAAWLVEAGGRIAGYALAGACDLPHPNVTGACGELKRLYLLPEFQNGGLGRRLFDTAIAWLTSERPRGLWIGVWSENHGAQRFYARQGFEVVGRYDFLVGRTHDLELILYRPAAEFSVNGGRRAHVLRETPPNS